ncbi:MAG: SpoVG family protein [Candidatus Omnitrophota bacterium]
METGLDLKIVRLHRFDGDSKLKAFVDVAIGDFIIKGLRVVNGEKGLFLSMPQEKGKDGKWYDTFYPVTDEARRILAGVVLAAYEE